MDSSSLSATDMVHVAVGPATRKYTKHLQWSIQKFQKENAKIVILHIHQSSKKVACTFGGEINHSELKPEHVHEIREVQKTNAERVLNHYLAVCHNKKMKAESLLIESEEVEKGLVEAIAEHKISKLVMGCAPEQKYSRKMNALTSEKAIYVNTHAPPSCKIWFVCKGNLILTRDIFPKDSPTSSGSTGILSSLSCNASTNVNIDYQDSLSISDLEENRSISEGDHIGVKVLLDRLNKVIEESKTLRTELFTESQRRQDVEKELIEATFRSTTAEMQLKRTKEALSNLEEERTGLGKQVAILESRLGEMSEELLSRDTTISKLEREKDEVIKSSDGQLGKEEENTKAKTVPICTVFSLSELSAATNNFDPELKIGEGGFGIVFKGRLRHTDVAVKLLKNQVLHERGSEFERELIVLSQVRHPHLVALIGACTESRALVYEYLPNGSLDDRLRCKNGTPPLTWIERTSIILQICSALLFLHSAGIIHGDLKPANIFLDANLTAKIGDFGLCRLIPEQESNMSAFIDTDPKGTFYYVDPEFIATCKLTLKSDVYAFGIIILQMLTGKPPLSIQAIVNRAVQSGVLHHVLDSKAGEWPYEQAMELARLGLKCCKLNRKDRPDLEKEVMKILEPLRVSVSSSTGSFGAGNSFKTPAYFLCPIREEIMYEPLVAADGFSYEAEAIIEWLSSGNDTSPVTSIKLSHLEVSPNNALKNAIQEWLRKTPI